MPLGYEHMKQEFFKEFLKQGLERKEALRKAMEKAAKIWNSSHPDDPVYPGRKD